MFGKNHGDQKRDHDGNCSVVEACKDKLLQLCPTAETPKDFGACFRDRNSDVSEECKEAVNSASQNTLYGHHGRPSVPKEVKEACEEDVEAACPDLEGREMFKCAHKNLDAFSYACKKAVADNLPPLSSTPDAILEACNKTDIDTCPGLDGWELVTCVHNHVETLSEPCKTVMVQYKSRMDRHPSSVMAASVGDLEQLAMQGAVEDAFTADQSPFRGRFSKGAAVGAVAMVVGLLVAAFFVVRRVRRGRRPVATPVAITFAPLAESTSTESVVVGIPVDRA